MRAHGRAWFVASALAAAATGCVAAFAVAGAAVASSPVVLAPIVSEWPEQFVVTGAKSEPLYTEHIRISRAADTFTAQIEVLSQGDTALGTQRSAVKVHPDGTIEWLHGCTKQPSHCASDPALRGFLATAAVVALARDGRLPAEATAREVHGTRVVCVDDAALHPDAAPVTVRLDPCFDRDTGAVLAHWSHESSAFVGATLAPGFAISRSPNSCCSVP